MLMNDRKKKSALLAVFSFVTFLVVTGILSVPAEAQEWPDIFDPTQLRTLNLEMDPLDWDMIQNDLTFDIEKPAWFWLDGEDSILVGVRHKSSDALNGSPDFLKVALKIDINEYVPGQVWHNLKKLSLENGDDVDVLAEGFAWRLHHVANCAEGYGYTHSPAYASWVKLYINGYYTGVYVNAEQRDKQFLKNRLLYVAGETWLYKKVGSDYTRLDVGVGNSPTLEALCYSPFADDPTCSTSPPDTLAAELPLLINMQSMLTMAAVNTFAQNPDALFTHGKNVYFADFLGGRTRMHIPWDQDSALSETMPEIYPSGGKYSDTLLAVPEFRDQYTQIMYDLLDGPFAETDLTAFLNATEVLLTSALNADPNNQIPEGETVADRFDELRSWVTNRRAQAYSLLDLLTDATIPDVE